MSAYIPITASTTAAPDGKHDELLEVHEAFEQLVAHDARKAELVKLRYFVDMSIEETADVIGISATTAKRDWTYARAWLFSEVRDPRSEIGGPESGGRPCLHRESGDESTVVSL